MRGSLAEIMPDMMMEMRMKGKDKISMIKTLMKAWTSIICFYICRHLAAMEDNHEGEMHDASEQVSNGRGNRGNRGNRKVEEAPE